MKNSKASPDTPRQKPDKIYEFSESASTKRVIPVEVATRFGIDPVLFSEASVAQAVSQAKAAQDEKKWDLKTFPGKK